MGGIFISYRRDDSSGYAGRVYDALCAHFSPELLFMDIDTIEPGLDFVEVIESAVAECDVLLAIIGKQWLRITDANGRRRLENPKDFVRLEIEAALTRNIRVIPVLVRGATMPGADELPEALAKLARRHAVELSDTRWRYDIGKLIETLKKACGADSSRSRASSQRSSRAIPLREPKYDIELKDVGENKDYVVHILSKIKGLTGSPQELVDNVPCIIARGASRTDAQNFQVVMKKVGSEVHLIEL